jgi:hypothetical protein
LSKNNLEYKGNRRQCAQKGCPHGEINELAYRGAIWKG